MTNSRRNNVSRKPRDASVVLSSSRKIERGILQVLEARGAKTCCPSEIPRKIFPADWRCWMDTTRDVARKLAKDRVIDITQNGVPIDPNREWVGPIRLRAGKNFPKRH